MFRTYTWPNRPWAPRETVHSKTGPICPTCQTIHGGDAARAVGKFDPAGVHGYVSRLGGPLRPTRAEAVADFCAAKAV